MKSQNACGMQIQNQRLGNTNIKEEVEEEGCMNRTEEEWAERSLSEWEKCDGINAKAVVTFKTLVMN